METYNFPRIVPQLVEDNSLKRARTTITEGGEEKEAIRVTSVGGSGGGLDAQGVADAMGLAASEVLNGSVLKQLQDTKADVSELLTKTNSISGYTSGAKTVLGAIGDSAWAGSGGTTIMGTQKRITLNSNEILTNTANVATATGTQSDAAWSGTGNGTVIALLKGIYNKL